MQECGELALTANEGSLQATVRLTIVTPVGLDLGMDGPAAYAYLSAAADFQVSQVVDRTTGVHALIRKDDFG